MVIRVCHHSLISDFFYFSFFWENFRYINQGTGQKKMSEDVVQNVSKSVCLAQKAYLLCMSNNISGLGPFFKTCVETVNPSQLFRLELVVNRIFSHFPVISGGYNRVDNRIANIVKIIC